MSPRDLLTDPCWQGSDLGKPLPDARHAVSVALPRWQDVIAYEEHDPACRQALQAVYPRFGFHPIVADLSRRALAASGAAPDSGMAAWPYATAAAAEAARAHCQRSQAQGSATIQTFAGLHCLITDPARSPAAKAFWQHAGLGASSRLAASALGLEPSTSDDAGASARSSVIERLAATYGCLPTDISLHPSGMAAQHQALRLVETVRPGRPTLQVGFPYVDVLKQPEVLFAGSELLVDSSPQTVEAALDRLQPAAVVVELPSNPLLRCVDLPAIANLAHARGIPVIADDTIGSAFNINPLPHADLVFSSLTKSFAGRGDVLAGSLTISPDSRWSDQFGQAMVSAAGQALANLANADAVALEQGSRDAGDRIPLLNAHTLALAERLEHHPAVKRLFHPRHCRQFSSLMRPRAGHGCLLSFELEGGEQQTRRVYDALEVCKGPSLGTPFTLVCPYVLLAHYDELPWAERCGVPSHLLRVSVGLEDPDELWARFTRALDA